MSRARFATRGVCVLLGGIAAPAFAAPEVVPSVTVSGGGLYSSNPFLTPGAARDGVAATVEVAPSVEIIGDRTQATISGNVGYTQYFGGLGNTSGFRIQGLVQHRATDRLSLNARASFDSSILGARAFNDPVRALALAPAVDVVPSPEATSTTPLTPLVTSPAPLFSPDNLTPGFGSGVVDSDLGLLGARQRRNLWSASGGLDYRISVRSGLSAEVNFSKASYPGGSTITEDYTSYGATLGYRRALSETTTVGLGFGASRVDYAQSRGTTVYSPRVSISQRFRGRFTWNANVGLAMVRQPTGSSTSAFADASLCQTGLRSSLCVSASYAPSITGVGSVRNQLGVSASYNYRLAERTLLSATVGYSQLTAQRTTVLGLPFQRAAQSFVSGDIVLNRRFSRTVSGYVGTSYRKLYDSSMNVKADFGVRVGIALTLGGRR